MKMTVTSVQLASDAYFVCLAHALSTEKEEIMGLLIGEIDENRVSHITAVIMLRRSDKQPDRVEISPEQLSDASTKAEELAHQLGRPMRVLGWYHSHPHITVWPSHVDVQTQAMYQMMDEGFIGLIFSVFNEDKATKQTRIQVTCFQSVNQSSDGQPPQYGTVEIALHIVPEQHLSAACMESLVHLPSIITLEEEEAYALCDQQQLDWLSNIHNGAVFTKSICQIMQTMNTPLLQMMESRKANNEQRIKQLQDLKKSLIQKIEALNSI